MLQSKQDGGREEDACIFELSDMEESTNASNGGVTNTNESVGGRPSSQNDDEVVSEFDSRLSQPNLEWHSDDVIFNQWLAFLNALHTLSNSYVYDKLL